MLRKAFWTGTVLFGVVACNTPSSTGTTQVMGGAAGAGGQGGAGETTTSDLLPTGPEGSGAGGNTSCANEADKDGDLDGFSIQQGDCNDCDENVNPGAIEVLTDII